MIVKRTFSIDYNHYQSKKGKNKKRTIQSVQTELKSKMKNIKNNINIAPVDQKNICRYL